MNKNAADKDKGEDVKLWGVFLFGLIGATASTLAFGHLRKTVEWFSIQLSRSQSSLKGGSGGSRTSFQEEAWRRHNKRMQEEYEEEMERVSAFRTKAKEYHPDQNQDNKDVVEAKFKEVMSSFEAIKQERGNQKM